MGRKWPFTYAPSTHSEHEDWCANYEFQKEWYPFAKQSRRYCIKKHSGAWHWWDGWGYSRQTQRSWKKFRNTQYKATDVRIL